MAWWPVLDFKSNNYYFRGFSTRTMVLKSWRKMEKISKIDFVICHLILLALYHKDNFPKDNFKIKGGYKKHKYYPVKLIGVNFIFLIWKRRMLLY